MPTTLEMHLLTCPAAAQLAVAFEWRSGHNWTFTHQLKRPSNGPFTEECPTLKRSSLQNTFLSIKSTMPSHLRPRNKGIKKKRTCRFNSVINFMTQLILRDVKMLKTNEIMVLLFKCSNNPLRNTGITTSQIVSHSPGLGDLPEAIQPVRGRAGRGRFPISSTRHLDLGQDHSPPENSALLINHTESASNGKSSTLTIIFL